MTQQTDITIIGAGLVGMTAACGLAKLGYNIIVIDSVNLSDTRKKESDGRTSAIAGGSAQFFKEIGVWGELQKYGGEIRDIWVTDNKSPMFLHYDHATVGAEPMGYIIENYHIREELFRFAEQLSNVKIMAPVKYTDVQFGEDNCVISLENGEVITTKLLLAADGKNSNIRKLAGIRTHDWDYNQSGLVCTISHEKHHDFTAQERFLPQGPFAALPMRNGYHSSLVWTEKTELIPTYMAMSNAEIEEQITLRIGTYLGKITLASRMYSYPLSLCKAKQYVKGRMILIGDAAHAIHPLAGQGFNVGIRDVIELYNTLQSSVKEYDINNCDFIKYERSRMVDSISMMAITDVLNRAFSNNILPLKTARRIGMGLVNKATPLKKFFIKHAMGE